MLVFGHFREVEATGIVGFQCLLLVPLPTVLTWEVVVAASILR